MGKAGDRKRTLEKKAESARRRQARLSASRQDLNADSDVAPAYPPPTVPASADSSGSQNSVTLPQTTSPHSLQSSGQSEGSDPEDTPDLNRPTGGLGGRPLAMGQRHGRLLGGIRDLRMLKRLMNQPDWQMPEGCEKALPVEAYAIARNRGQDGKPAEYSPGTRLKAIEVLDRMKADNQRKIVAGVRLHQLGRRIDIMEEHPEIMAGGNVTNNVVIYLPSEAPMDKYAVDEPPRTIDAKPSGNGNGRPKA